MEWTSTMRSTLVTYRDDRELAEQGLRELTKDETALVGGGGGWAKFRHGFTKFSGSDSSPSKADGGASDGARPTEAFAHEPARPVLKEIENNVDTRNG